MSTHIDGLHTQNTRITLSTNDELGEQYNEIEEVGDEKVLALEAPGNCHLVVVEGDLEQFARDVWKAVFGRVPEKAWYTCDDCHSGDMVEDAARWHESREGHTVREISQPSA